MTIERIRAYRLELPFADGAYRLSGGRADLAFDSTVVAIDTDRGVTGWGEMAPLGATYDAAFAGGVRAALALLAPGLIGAPLEPATLQRRMAGLLRGHPYARSALDMAIWDALGRTAGLPLHVLLGGGRGEAVDLYRSVWIGTPAEMAALAADFVGRGYRRLQVKVGTDPLLDAARVRAVRDAVGPGVPLFADANGGFSQGAARRFLVALGDLDVHVEQPCATLADCLALRPHCRHPLVVDESITDLRALVAAHAGGVDGITIKLSRVGGITPARAIRDAAVELGIAVTAEDSGGSDIDTAAMAHVSVSTPAALRVHTVDFNRWVTVANATGMPAPLDGRLAAPDAPGLGVEPIVEVLGAPIATWE